MKYMKYIYLLDKAHVIHKLYNKCALRARDPHKQPKSLHEESPCFPKQLDLNTHTHTYITTHTYTQLTKT